MDRDQDYSAYVTARWASLVRAAVLLGCSRADAEDVVQSTLVRCYVAWAKVQRADDRGAYVYRAGFGYPGASHSLGRPILESRGPRAFVATQRGTTSVSVDLPVCAGSADAQCRGGIAMTALLLVHVVR